MILIFEIAIVVLYIGGIFYQLWMNKKYHNNTSAAKEEIINYLRNKQRYLQKRESRQRICRRA